MPNFNIVILVGHLTRDPSLEYTQSQTAVVNFGMAMNRKWTSQSGEDREEVCFIELRAFGSLAEAINKYCKKGMPLLVEGRLRQERWNQDDGTNRSRLLVTVESFQFLGGKKCTGDD